MTDPPAIEDLRDVADRAEAALLGVLLIGGGVDVAAAAVGDDVDAWGRDSHRAVWDAIRAVHDTEGDVDTVAVTQRLARSGRLDEVGGAVALVDLAAAAPASSTVSSWAVQVAEAAQRRRAYRAAHQLLRDVQDPSTDPWAALERLRDLEEGTAGGLDALEFTTIGDLAAQVDAEGPRQWLLEGIWPAGDYGVHSAEQKAQKTWNTADLAVSVASGTPWLGHVPVGTTGPVLMFIGEGGRANTVRRLRGVAAERGVRLEDLPIHVCTRAPHLADGRHMAELRRKVHDVQPALVTLDPLYLAARGADRGDLYAMGALLEEPQRICQQAGTSLWVVHHHNRTGRSGAGAISGAGPAEWGRVLVTGVVKARHTDPDTLASDVVCELEVIGGEVADRTLRVRRRIETDDPADLDAPFTIVTTVTAGGQPDGRDTDDPEANLPPAAQKLLEAARTEPDRDWTSSALVDVVADLHGHGLRRETVSRHLNEFEDAGLFVGEPQGPFEEKLWRLASPRVTSRDQIEDHATKDAESSRDARDVTRDDHAGEAHVTRVTPPVKGVTQSRDAGHATATCRSCGQQPPVEFPATPEHVGLCADCTPARAAS